MNFVTRLFLALSIFFCCADVFAFVNNNAYNNTAPAASQDNSLEDSDTISGSDAHPDDPEMQPPASRNPGLQPDASPNPGLQPED